MDSDLIVIHTNKYAGNFEREMAAFITGQVGDCGVGRNKIDDEVDYSIFEDNVTELPDENGCRRPVSIYPNPNHLNNGLGFQFKKDDEEKKLEGFKLNQAYHLNRNEESIESYQQAIDDFKENGEDGEHFNGYKNAGWDLESLEEQLVYCKEQILVYKNKTIDDAWFFPAYNSVAISFYIGTIDDEIIKTVKERAEMYAKSHGIEIEGFEVVEVRTALIGRKI